MKKTELSLLICTFFAAVLLCGCKFNLSNTNYLNRPDVIARDGYFEIIAPYISEKTKSITIYRQNVHDRTDSEIERVAIVFPSGIEDTSDQTMHYDDERVLAGQEYRYYIRFTDDKGIRNRTDWSEKKVLQSGGAPSKDKISYTVNNHYTYNEETMILSCTADFTAPDSSIIKDISEYKPALVLQAGEKIQVFEVPGGDTKSVNLKSLLPEDYLYVDVTLLGIVGQKTKKNSKDETLTQSISWTVITPITVKNTAGNPTNPFQLNPEHGEAGNDYTTTSDNETK